MALTIGFDLFVVDYNLVNLSKQFNGNKYINLRFSINYYIRRLMLKAVPISLICQINFRCPISNLKRYMWIRGVIKN